MHSRESRGRGEKEKNVAKHLAFWQHSATSCNASDGFGASSRRNADVPSFNSPHCSLDRGEDKHSSYPMRLNFSLFALISWHMCYENKHIAYAMRLNFKLIRCKITNTCGNAVSSACPVQDGGSQKMHRRRERYNDAAPTTARQI